MAIETPTMDGKPLTTLVASPAARNGARLPAPVNGSASNLSRIHSIPFVSIIIVNYNGKRYLDDCLASLAAQSVPCERWEAILVDNGSTDGSAEYVRRHFPWVRLVARVKNGGFAQGNNEGIRHAQGELIALLNNDTVVDPHWLAELIRGIESDSRIGAVTSKILLKNEVGRINSAGLNLYQDGRGGDRGFRQPDQGQFDEPAEVFGACGASVLLRRAMLDDIGGLDERFFMYYEDLDLAWRARLRGWAIRYTPRSIVYHVHCGTAGEWSPFFLFHVERNRVFVNLKNAPARLALRSLAVFAARAVRKWFRVATLRDRSALDRRQAWMYVPSGLSLLVALPEMLWKRYLIRTLRRKVSDRALASLMSPPPGR
jgi:GT2 family glycosyltransferase